MKISYYFESIEANVVDVVVNTIKVTNHLMNSAIFVMKFKAQVTILNVNANWIVHKYEHKIGMGHWVIGSSSKIPSTDWVAFIVHASLASRKTQDLIMQDFSRKTLGAILTRQKFTKNYFSGQNWSVFTKLFKWE